MTAALADGMPSTKLAESKVKRLSACCVWGDMRQRDFIEIATGATAARPIAVRAPRTAHRVASRLDRHGRSPREIHFGATAK